MDDGGGIVAVHQLREMADLSVAAFEKTYKGPVQHFLDLRAKAQSGDAAAQVEFTLLEGQLNRIGFDEASNRLDGKTLTDAQKTALSDLEFAGMINALKGARDEASHKAALKTIADTFAAGRAPSGGDDRGMFLDASLGYAIREKNADLAQKAVDALKPFYEEKVGKDDPRLQQWHKQVSDKIAEIRAEKAPPPSDEGIEESDGDKGAK
jgi:hypothetical protein